MIARSRTRPFLPLRYITVVISGPSTTSHPTISRMSVAPPITLKYGGGYHSASIDAISAVAMTTLMVKWMPPAFHRVMAQVREVQAVHGASKSNATHARDDGAATGSQKPQTGQALSGT